jgi:hypothetical protein
MTSQTTPKVETSFAGQKTTPVHPFEDLLDKATEFEVKKNDKEAANIYFRMINDESRSCGSALCIAHRCLCADATGTEDMKLKEVAVNKLADSYVKNKFVTTDRTDGLS